MLEAGAAVPVVTIPDDTGKPVSLPELAASKVVVWFYPKADTPG